MSVTTEITSLINPRIKQVVKLRDRRTRDELRLSIVEGVREISRAAQAGLALKEIYFCAEFLAKYSQPDFAVKIAGKDSMLYEVTPEVFEKISFGDRREGVLALFEPPVKGLTSLSVRPQSVFLVADGIEKPGNLGAVLRTCDGGGVDALLAADERADLYNPNTIRSSMGTVFSLPVVKAGAKEIFKFLKDHKVDIVASSPAAKTIYFEKSFRFPVALVLGSEPEGLSDFWLKNSDSQIKIPMLGKADSLNVSNTAAILVYEMLRQQRIASRAS